MDSITGKKEGGLSPYVVFNQATGNLLKQIDLFIFTIHNYNKTEMLFVPLSCTISLSMHVKYVMKTLYNSSLGT